MLGNNLNASNFVQKKQATNKSVNHLSKHFVGPIMTDPLRCHFVQIKCIMVTKPSMDTIRSMLSLVGSEEIKWPVFILTK